MNKLIIKIIAKSLLEKRGKAQKNKIVIKFDKKIEEDLMLFNLSASLEDNILSCKLASGQKTLEEFNIVRGNTLEFIPKLKDINIKYYFKFK